eukprot:gnl/Spiro4/23491_TR11609_c0_g2_i2.p1 gnl/Spiro4/23491_TR11609_c0_g2~~gnl/Spiro4/23491_TR11609_c0_g2_i2.p1  ORF type:complete len:265 (+),score=30.55 gnl/Spiro4/23491_TR11609_c0_g2_i2:73-867(+)
MLVFIDFTSSSEFPFPLEVHDWWSVWELRCEIQTHVNFSLENVDIRIRTVGTGYDKPLRNSKLLRDYNIQPYTKITVVRPLCLLSCGSVSATPTSTPSHASSSALPCSVFSPHATIPIATLAPSFHYQSLAYSPLLQEPPPCSSSSSREVDLCMQISPSSPSSLPSSSFEQPHQQRMCVYSAAQFDSCNNNNSNNNNNNNSNTSNNDNCKVRLSVKQTCEGGTPFAAWMLVCGETSPCVNGNCDNKVLQLKVSRLSQVEVEPES